MARQSTPHPTDGELEILRILWQRGPCSLGTLWSELNRDREVAKTTVATMLKVLLEKGLAQRKRTADGYRWSAALTREAATQGLVGKLLDSIFDGSAGRLVAHLVDDGRLGKRELAEIEQLFQAARASKKKSTTTRRRKQS